MRLVFIGASKFGYRCLQACFEMRDFQIVGVVSAPKTFSISYRPQGVVNILHADILELAQMHAVPTLMIDKGMCEEKLFESIKLWRPDLFLVVGWYHMIPRRWRELAPAFGLHASLLPDYSGGAPLVWAMINGEEKTGITMFRMDDGVDTGLIAGQKPEFIFPDDTIATLYARIEGRGLELVREILPQYMNGTVNWITQDESRRRLMPQRTPEDGKIDWSWDCTKIDRFIRAQTKPYPGAFGILNDKKLHIWKARIDQSINPLPQPGKILHILEKGYAIGCNDGAVILESISFNAQDFTIDTLPTLLGEGRQNFNVAIC